MLKSVNQRLVSSQFYIKDSSCLAFHRLVHVSRFMIHVSISVVIAMPLRVSCFLFLISCGHLNATSCFVFRVSSIMFHVSCFVFHAQ